MTRPTYNATATRDGEWWSLVADLGHREVASQCKRLEQADEMIREAIAMVLDVDEASFDVEVIPRLRPELQEAAERAAETRARYDELEEELHERTLRAVVSLRDEGLSVRDIAELVHVTPSRVSQIEKKAVTSTGHVMKKSVRQGKRMKTSRGSNAWAKKDRGSSSKTSG